MKSTCITALVKTGVVESLGRGTREITADSIKEAAELYLHNVRLIHQICEANGIACFTFLQPSIFSKEPLSTLERETSENWLMHQPDFKRILSEGYDKVRADGDSIIDLSNILNGLEQTVFFDPFSLNLSRCSQTGQGSP